MLNRLILEPLSTDKLRWLSPLEEDDFAEYADMAFLDRIGRPEFEELLKDFWPKRGPVWDGLASSDRGDLILVEAKSHIGEICSPGTQASPESRRLIEKSLSDAAQAMNSKNPDLWPRLFYQYANRLAHLWWLRTQCSADAWLVFVYFLDDTNMNGPTNIAEWEASLALVRHVLGIERRHPLSKYVIDIFVSVGDLECYEQHT